MIKAKKIIFQDNLYQLKIILFYSTWEDFYSYLVKEKLEFMVPEKYDKNSLGHDGFHFLIPELTECYIFVNSYNDFKKEHLNLRSLVHELSHTVIAIFELRDIPINSKNSEVFCYYFDFLFDFFYSKLNT